MMVEKQTNLEAETKKEAWLKTLGEFIVIANGKTWAGEGAEVEPKRPGYKRLQWPYPEDRMSQDDHQAYEGFEDWRMEDEYTGFFRAPGMTTVYYKDEPVWTMQYGGRGQEPGHYTEAKETFKFLKSALMEVFTDMPYRGPNVHIRGKWRYNFRMKGGLTDCIWSEKIFKNGELYFSQEGLAGIVIQKNSQGKPIYPWDL